MRRISINPVKKLLGLFHGILVTERKRWQASIGTGLRYLILGYLIMQLFEQLPENIWNIIYSQCSNEQFSRMFPCNK